MSAQRPPRADAARNARAILEAARTVIAEQGAGASMARIAREAGVAVGTLYRHHPTKADLVGAVVEEFYADVAADAEAVADRVETGADPVAELRAFARRTADAIARTDAAKATGLAPGGEAGERRRAAEERAVAAIERTLAVGRGPGALHADVTVQDLCLLVEAIPADSGAGVRERWTELALRALATG